VGHYLDTLLTINSTRILNDFDQRVRDSGRKLESRIRSQLREIRKTARRTLEHAELKQKEGAEAVSQEIERLDLLRAHCDPAKRYGGISHRERVGS